MSHAGLRIVRLDLAIVQSWIEAIRTSLWISQTLPRMIGTFPGGIRTLLGVARTRLGMIRTSAQMTWS